MPNWNWSSVEIRASCAASWTVWGNSPGGRAAKKAHMRRTNSSLVCGVVPARETSSANEPQDVGQQRIDGADHGLVGEACRPQDAIDGLAEPEAVGAEAGLLEGEGDDSGVGEQVGADLLAQGGQLLGPVPGGVGVQVQAGIHLVDEPVDQVGFAADAVVEGVGGDAEAVGQAAHGQGPGALLVEQGQGFFDDFLAAQ
jgi:hypothetical protein